MEESSLMRDLYFNFPQAMYLLFFVPILILLIWSLARYRQFIANSYTRSSLIAPRSSQLIKNSALVLAWMFGCLALMDPRGNLTYFSDQKNASTLLEMPAHEIIFLIDTSSSMAVSDTMQGNSRLKQAKQITEEMIEQLEGQDVSVYTFTSQLIPLVPATLDYLFARLMVEEIRLNEGDVGGTNFAQVLQSLKQKFSVSSKLYTFILLSDGGDNQIELLPQKEQQAAIDKAIASLPNSPILTIGIGSEKGENIPNVTFQGKPVLSKLENALLQKIAQASGGKYYNANQYSTWEITQQLIKEIHMAEALTTDRSVKPLKEQIVLYDLYYQIPLLLALLLLLIYRILPDTMKKGF
jgi:Ca-activated chloride channel family protein